MKKGDIFEGVIEKVDFPNKGRVFLDGETVTVKNGIPGQSVRACVNKKRGKNLEARLIEVIEPSPLEKRAPLCRNFPACGGCMYQTMTYEDQLEMKKNQLKELLDAAIAAGGQRLDAGTEAESGAEMASGTEAACGAPNAYAFDGMIPSPEETGYRNKMEFSFGDAYKGGPLSLGLHRKGSTYDVLTTDDCKIVHEDFCKILRCVLDYFTEFPAPFYQKVRHEGYLRHLLLRRSFASGELLVNLVTTSQGAYDLQPLVRRLLALEADGLSGRIAGILHIINDSPADVVKSDEMRVLYGRDHIFETVLGLKFKITPFSFFQTNTPGAERLYSAVRRYIGETRDRVIFDLYSGTGTIAQILAPVAKKVIGVEIVDEAVAAARVNAELNGLDNCTFLAGDVLKVLDEIEEKPDAIVLDPPRDGIHPRALKKIIDYGAERIIYISCKPTSLARDLGPLLGAGYRVERMCFVDLFAQTVHAETVVLMTRGKD